jgi:hypothetical protein
MKQLYYILVGLVLCSTSALAQDNTDNSKFRQLGTELPTPNSFRTASGAPGHEYWQQRADFDIKVELDEANNRIIGQETITYFNNSPNPLTYLWLQLDQNIESPNSMAKSTETNQLNERSTLGQLNGMLDQSFDGGHKIQYVRDANGKAVEIYHQQHHDAGGFATAISTKNREKWYFLSVGIIILPIAWIHHSKRSRWLRILPGRRQLALYDYPMVSAHGGL